MVSAVHLINKATAGGDLERLTQVGDGRYRTCCWALAPGDAARLDGGWVYLHETKAAPSRFGGRIVGVEPVRSAEFAHEDRFAMVFVPHLAAKATPWRGKAHAMAWTGGIVDADRPHEIARD